MKQTKKKIVPYLYGTKIKYTICWNIIDSKFMVNYIHIKKSKHRKILYNQGMKKFYIIEE